MRIRSWREYRIRLGKEKRKYFPSWSSSKKIMPIGGTVIGKGEIERKRDCVCVGV